MQLDAALDAVAYDSGGTAIGRALDFVRTDVLQQEDDKTTTNETNKEEAAKTVVVLLTDGDSRDGVVVPGNRDFYLF